VPGNTVQRLTSFKTNINKPLKKQTDMKKMFSIFLIIMIGLCAAMTSTAQDKTIKLKPGATYMNVTCTAADTIKTSDTLWVLAQSDKDHPATQDVLAKLTKVSGSPKLYVSLWGRKFSTSAWTSIATYTYSGGATDTTIVLSNATANRYRNYKFQLISSATAGQKTRLSKLEFKEYY
jgi:hypothetical protein